MSETTTETLEDGQSDPVLVVDSDADVRSLLSLTLRRAGLQVVEASTGEEALTVVQQQPISVMVCHLNLPAMSALDVVRELRRRPETATLPVLVLTGAGTPDSVVEVLEAGADDYLSKPVRLDEFIARVRAHLRVQGVWTSKLDGEIISRAEGVRAIGRLHLTSDPEEIAVQVVKELVQRTGPSNVGVFQLSAGDRLVPLARYNVARGVVRGGPDLPVGRAQVLVARLPTGPWVQDLEQPEPHHQGDDMFWLDPPDVAAGAPIYLGDNVVGLLTLGARIQPGEAGAPVRAKLLAAAIDYASVLSAVAGPAIEDRRNAEKEHDRLQRQLNNNEFHIVFQPIVDLASGTIIGHEALTRFADQKAPNIRFEEAAAAGLGVQYELASIGKAIEGARSLPTGLFLSLNISPSTVIAAGRRLAKLLETANRPCVIELTEHARISDYKSLRSAIRRLPDVSVAVDDAGAGYASLNHILELEPKFAKLDISLVRGIDTDLRRQGMAAGLAFFATRTGCSLIAEGIEHLPEADTLLYLGVEFGQGYYFGRPARIDQDQTPIAG